MNLLNKPDIPESIVVREWQKRHPYMVGHSSFIRMDGSTVMLDGHFTAKDLRALVDLMDSWPQDHSSVKTKS